MRISYCVFSLTTLLFVDNLAFAQISGEAQAFSKRPVLDGKIRGEDVWEKAKPMTGFVQVKPIEGNPASQKTEVFIGYTSESLYVGVVCYDDDPGSIISSSNKASKMALFSVQIHRVSNTMGKLPLLR